jgi:hypothetical protein
VIGVATLFDPLVLRGELGHADPAMTAKCLSRPRLPGDKTTVAEHL